MRLWKYSGTYLVLTGILHTIVAGILYKEPLLEIIKSGLINGVKENTPQDTAFWFLVCGLIIILFGMTLQHYLRRTYKPAPKFIGYFLLVFSLLGGIIVPVSGFWLFVPQALIIILAKERR
ncbi:MAG: DUF6463 family protein [Dysgonomonas sp.]|nr:DUF6463 family protein [Dysgonomonas sp.]